MDLGSLISTATGGGLVLILSQFVFGRLIHQVDRLADKITKLEILHAKISEKIINIDRLEEHINEADTRLVRLETLVKVGNH